MWEHLSVALLLQRAGFCLKDNYEDTLNHYFLENQEDEILLELEFASSDFKKSFGILRKVWDTGKFNKRKFAVMICERLEEIYEDTPLKEFVPRAYKLWQILPVCRLDAPLVDLSYFNKPPTKKNVDLADATYREMFRYYKDGLDKEPIVRKSITIQEYLSVKPGSIAPDFERAELLLGFELSKGVRDFYSRVFALKISGCVLIPEEGFTVPMGNKRFDEWFRFNEIKGRTELRLFPCECLRSSARFLYDQFNKWTGGNNFGQRVRIGEFHTGIGEILILINNQSGAVEWVDCEYGQYEKYEKNPNGILAEDMDQFLIKLMKWMEG